MGHDAGRAAYPEIELPQSAYWGRGRSVKAETERTEVIQGDKEVLAAVTGFFKKARTRLDFSISYVGPRTGAGLVDALTEARKRGVRCRMVTEVTKENAKAVRAAVTFLEVRHVAGLTANSWAVTDDEYASSLAVGEFRPSLPIIYSNTHSLVAEHQSIFEALWSRGEAVQERLKSLGKGSGLPEFEIIRDTKRIRELYISLIEGARSRVHLLLPTAAAFRRDDEIGVIDALESAAARGVKVRILTPLDQWVLTRLPSSKSQSRARTILYRPIPPADTPETVTVLVVDQSASLTIDERDSTKSDFGEAVGVALVATSEPRVRQNIRFFERSWMESELREAEKSAKELEQTSRRRAELMQDILTHDIRNFNQVARLNAELLGEVLKDRESTKRVSAILRAVDGSTRLIERTKKLGSIMAAGEVKVHSVNLRSSFDRSLNLVRKGNPSARIQVESNLSGDVLADELLDEVFVNLLSNSVKYTEGNRVRVRVIQEAVESPNRPHGNQMEYWKISISDWGRGIPEITRASVFKRYLETAKGSGLGLSIVYALVTERYHGRVEMKDRVDGDYAKGTTVELWLPKA
jgi:signal transduction histidine kinase